MTRHNIKRRRHISLILYINLSCVRYDMLDKTLAGNIIIWGAGWSGAE